jgi:dihydroxy-acid dehydratase
MSNEKGLRAKRANYGDAEFSLFLRKAFIKAMGYTDEALERPIVGIVNTYSGYNACHRNVPEMIEAIRRGVMLYGGLPIDFPVISIHESFANPTSMYLRNLMAIDVEEMIRAQPMDAVVLIGGCDKTVPALLMGAASAGVPAILTVTGPMLSGSHRGERIGACTDCRRLWGEFRGGRISQVEIDEANAQLAPSAGTCSVMGTASTMALTAEAAGIMLPRGASAPAVHADRLRHAERTGARAVALAAEGLTPDRILTPKAITNALTVLHATGGSTNGLIHWAAIAGRLGIGIDLDGFDRLGRATPVIVDLKPTGQHYMEDLHKAGGLTTILRELEAHLALDCLTISGRTLAEDIAAAPPAFTQDVVRPVADPLKAEGGIRVLTGSLAPSGAIIKQSAADPALMEHEGTAVVFDGLEDMATKLDDPALDVSAADVLVLRNAGPLGAPGMPEAGYIPIPKKLAAQGVKDMVRMSDARMSGTAFGTIVLHISPEAAVGGPLALVKTGDRIRLDVPAGRLDLLVAEDELARRKAALAPQREAPARGYARLYAQEVMQAEDGCDFAFLRPPIVAKVPVA